MKPAGYLIKHPDRLEGERGQYFDYVLAGNGLFIEAEGRFMAARIPVSSVEVRGLQDIEPRIVLRYGKIPRYIFDLAFNWMAANADQEKFVAITWNNGYHLQFPDQKMETFNVHYEVADNTVMDLHSHGHMNAFFSIQDNRDEQGFQLYGVVGRLHQYSNLRLRVGVYGYHYDIAWNDIFEGYCPITEFEEEKIDDIQIDLAKSDSQDKDCSSGWLRWYRRLRSRGVMPVIAKR